MSDLQASQYIAIALMTGIIGGFGYAASAVTYSGISMVRGAIRGVRQESMVAEEDVVNTIETRKNYFVPESTSRAAWRGATEKLSQDWKDKSMDGIPLRSVIPALAFSALFLWSVGDLIDEYNNSIHEAKPEVQEEASPNTSAQLLTPEEMARFDLSGLEPSV